MMIRLSSISGLKYMDQQQHVYIYIYMLLLIHIFETRNRRKPYHHLLSTALLMQLMMLNLISRISALKETLSRTDRGHQMHWLGNTDLEEHLLENTASMYAHSGTCC